MNSFIFKYTHPHTPTAKDCYLIGRSAYMQENWQHTRSWMLEVLRKFDEEDDSDVDLVSLYDHLAYAEYQVSMCGGGEKRGEVCQVRREKCVGYEGRNVSGIRGEVCQV